jgi:hydantoinase/carbamoylase family amidase
MASSGVWAGKIPLQTAYELEDVDGSGATQRSELERIGYLGETPASHKHNPLAAHFELHIEQGPVLESGARKIGVVHGVQAYKWFVVEVIGRACHTGTTPFSNRADALLAASRMIAESHAIATRHGGLASTGVLTIPTSSFNVVPGKVTFSLDIRSPKDEIVSSMEQEIRSAFQAIASGTGALLKDSTPGMPCEVKISTFTDSPAVNFHQDCIECIDAAAEGAFGSEALSRVQKQMTSGAGHDSAYTSYVCPTAMIFVPCRDGISHNPREYTTPADCAGGAQVLMGSVLRYDRLRAERNV